MDGCSAPLDDAERDAKHRMLARRREPVTIPHLERAPVEVADADERTRWTGASARP